MIGAGTFRRQQQEHEIDRLAVHREDLVAGPHRDARRLKRRPCLRVGRLARQHPVDDPPPGRVAGDVRAELPDRARLAAIVVAVVLVLGFWAPGFFVTTKLDVGKAEAGVQQILTDGTNGYGAKNVKDVKCNNGQNPTVKKGASFDCDVSIDGTKRQVTVTFQDNKGTYEVGRPK